ncbi:hypothetical protein ACTQ56_06865 [[Clostridium] aminophilum]|uniref:hypothetical protein n=1 Tax=[Clostridium] aminophilum TaxID=1526 RepID=UPI003F9AACBF
MWDDNLNNFVVELKARHFHAAVKFALDKETGKVMDGTLAQIASAIGVEPQYVEKAEKGRYAWDNMLSYLIHIKYADKEPYSPDEVYSAGITVNGVPKYKSYLEIYRERKKAWEDGKAKVSAKQANMNVELLEEKILTGEVKRSQVLLTDALFNIYARNKRRIDDAFEDRIIEEDQEERRERDESILKAEEERYEAEIDEAVRLYQMRKAREEY